MSSGTRILLTIALSAAALPVAAQAPAPTATAFDGTYTGVSRTLEGTMAGPGTRTRSCPPSGGVAPLTIVNGIARTKALGTAEGSVSPQGVVVMKALAGFGAGSRFEGQIDGHGTLTGRFTASCSYQVVWQKASK
jgi:hypothetical protein